MRVSKQRTALLLLTMLLALGAFTPAALASSVDLDDGTLVYTAGDDLSHEVQFRFNDSNPPCVDGCFDEILDTEAITSYPTPECAPASSTHLFCDYSNAVQVELGGGNDKVYFDQGAGDCFPAYLINLGNGNDQNFMDTTCTQASTGTINAGSGNDILRGGSPVTTMAINAGSGDDDVNPSSSSDGPGRDIVHAGEGADLLAGEAGNDQLYGEGGHDEILGGGGGDIEDGGTGDDWIGYHDVANDGDNDQGADHYRGGTGFDSLFLNEHSGGMAISLDGQANDGSPGEGDNVGSDFESILGTLAKDVFRGSAGPDRYEGHSGDDEIHGAGGDDTLLGGPSNNSIFGDGGNDVLEGGAGADRVEGGAGRDKLYGVKAGCRGYACDFHLGDALFAVDGEADTADCSGGGTANVDQFDDARGLCNKVNRVNVAAAGGGGTLAKATFRGSKRSIKVSRKGRFTYTFRAGASLRGKAVFRSLKKVRVSKRARATLASKAFKASKKGKVTLKIKLSRKALKILRRNRKIKTKVTVTLRSGGLSSVASATVTLKR